MGVTVLFGGKCRELWTNDGLCVSYEDAVKVLALREDGGWRAEPVSADPTLGVKAAHALLDRSRELASRLNTGAVPPLTLAYFRAAAEAASMLSAPEPSGLPPVTLKGGHDAVILPELLRLLLDQRGMGWDEAMDLIARRFSLNADVPSLLLPMGALEGLQPRDASLLRAVAEKHRARLWDANPGDWGRIASSAVIKDGEADMTALCAVMCGRIFCTKERRAGELRALFALMPAKFEELC